MTFHVYEFFPHFVCPVIDWDVKASYLQYILMNIIGVHKP